MRLHDLIAHHQAQPGPGDAAAAQRAFGGSKWLEDVIQDREGLPLPLSTTASSIQRSSSPVVIVAVPPCGSAQGAGLTRVRRLCICPVDNCPVP